jgi:hypothetical protein
LYADLGDPFPLRVTQGTSFPSARLGSHLQVLPIPADSDLFTVLPKSRTLSPALLIPRKIQAFVERTCVVQVFRGPQKLKILLFYGRTHDLSWDPNRLQWSNDKPIMEYSTKMGREFLRALRPIPNIPQLRWSDNLPAGFTFRCKANWEADRASKESGLIWQIWHRAVAVNEWRAKISPQVELECLLCNTGEAESVTHCFWNCPQGQAAWKFTVVVLSALSPGGSLTSFEAQHALFAQRMPRRFQHCGAIWIYLRSATVWTSLTDCGRAAWLRLQKRKFKNEAARIEAIGNFMAIWTVNEYLYTRDRDRILWNRFTFNPGGDFWAGGDFLTLP